MYRAQAKRAYARNARVGLDDATKKWRARCKYGHLRKNRNGRDFAKPRRQRRATTPAAAAIAGLVLWLIHFK